MKKNSSLNTSVSEFDIAVIGMSCRFPGAKNIVEFWKNLSEGVESITRFSDDELLESGVPASYLNNPNYVKASPIIDDPGLFDANFWGYSPMEAKMLDPQHRILLECAHEALEHAGYDPDRFRGPIGVFTGSAMNTYFMNTGLYSKFIDEYIPVLIGNDKDFLSTRLSYKLNLRGPSITVQTACSTSLVALHLACQSLLSEESDMALAGAISIKVPHRAGYICEGGGIVSSDGHVRAFDADANGTVFGSGGGIIVLKRLTEAINEGDTIHAVIKGTAVNNDGSAKVGYTAPSVDSQASVVIESLSNSGLKAEEISYIEAHGSGTPVGDPIEILALTKAFRKFTELNGFCAIGSVKTNVGHLDAAAGIASIIKTILCLKNKKIPPSINYAKPNPEINFDETPFFVNTKLIDWDGTIPRRAGIMSTGMGGTNAHVILEEAPTIEKGERTGKTQLFLVSAKSDEALYRRAEDLSNFINNNPKHNFEDIAFTLQVGRCHYSHRGFFLSDKREEIANQLINKDYKHFKSYQINETERKNICFLFPGVGDQYIGMGRELYENIVLFKDELDRCSKIIESYTGSNIYDILFPRDYTVNKNQTSEKIDLRKMLSNQKAKSQDQKTQILNHTINIQPILFSLEYSLARLWIELGVSPNFLVGHSLGEYVAAAISGVFSLEDALKVVIKRAELVNKLPLGAMLAVNLAESELKDILPDNLSISLINAQKLCVVAGPENEIESFEKILKEKEIIYRYVQNAHAFHSKMMDPIIDEFISEVKKVKLNRPKIPFISNVTGDWIKEEEAIDPNYWGKHTNHSARFSDALTKIWENKNNLLLEIGPGKTLGVLAMQHLDRKKTESPIIINMLRYDHENESDMDIFLRSLGNVWATGIDIEWEKLYHPAVPNRIPLPTYPFDRKDYWIKIEKEKSLGLENLDEKNYAEIASDLIKSEKFRRLIPKLIEAISELKGNNTKKMVSSSDELLYELNWMPIKKIENIRDEFIDINPAKISEEIGKELDHFRTDPKFLNQDELTKDLEDLSLSYIFYTLDALGGIFELCGRFSIDYLKERLKIIPSQHRLLMRFLRILKNEGYLKETNDSWEIIQVPSIVQSPEDKFATLIQKYPEANVEINLIKRCGKELKNVLNGNINPLELLFPSGELLLATKLYQDSSVFWTLNTLIKSAVVMAINAMLHKKPIRILEIGGGTGGTTSRILPYISTEKCEYTFTDISKIFINNAKERFSEYSNVKYALLDIGSNIELQGYKKSHYDIVIASNVLHTTEDIQSTIRNVNQLLKKGGLLILLEGTKPMYWMDLFAGVLDGWWKFRDYNVRPFHPLVPVELWPELLRKSGFKNITLVNPEETIKGGLYGQVVFIAQSNNKNDHDEDTAGEEWLIFSDTKGVGENIASQLSAIGGRYKIIFKGDKFELIDEVRAMINPMSQEDFKDLFDRFLSDDHHRTYRILYAWCLDATDSASLNHDSVKQNVLTVSMSLVNLLNSFNGNTIKMPKAIDIITKGAQIAKEYDNISGISQSTIWGLGKTISLEYPSIKTRLVDLDTLDNNLLKYLIELDSLTSEFESEIALRCDEILVPRLIRSKIILSRKDSDPNYLIDVTKTYLITGGLGKIGLELAKWLVDKGIKNIVITTIDEFPESESWIETMKDGHELQNSISIIRELNKKGADINVLKADVTSLSDMSRVFNFIGSSRPALKGIFHLAGNFEYSYLNNLTLDCLKKIYFPKILGALVLHRLTVDKNIDFQIYFSSAASIWGGKGQGHYAAANIFMDTLARFRNYLGLPALSINWGKFSKVSMISKEYHDWLSNIGMGDIHLEESFSIMNGLLKGKKAQVIVSRTDWSKLKNIFEAFGKKTVYEQIENTSNYEMEVISDNESIIQVSDNNSLLFYLKKEVADSLGINQNEMSDDTPLNLLGLDSLMAVGLRNRLKKNTGLDIHIVDLIDGSCISEIAAKYEKNLGRNKLEIISGEI